MLSTNPHATGVSRKAAAVPWPATLAANSKGGLSSGRSVCAIISRTLTLLALPSPAAAKHVESHTMLAFAPWLTIASATSPFASGRLQIFSQIAFEALGAGSHGPGSPPPHVMLAFTLEV